MVAAVAATIVGVLPGACSPSADSAAKTPIRWRDPGGLPCGEVPEATGRTNARATGTGRSLSVHHVGDFPFTSLVGLVKLWGSYLTFREPDQRAILVCNLATGKVAAIASADEPAAVFGPAVGARSTIVYTEMTSGGARDGVTGWRIRALDLRTGSRRDLAKSPERTGPGRRFVPQPYVDWPWVAWVEASNGDEEARQVRVVDLRDGRSRLLVESSARPTLVGVTGGLVVYEAATGEGTGDEKEHDGHDLFAVDPSTGERQRLSAQGGVNGFVAANGWVAWRRTDDPGRPPETWVAPVDGSRPPARLGASEQSVPLEHAVPGDGYVVADHDGQLGVFDLDRPDGQPLPLHDQASRWRDRQFSWDADGTLAVWATAEMPLRQPLRRHLHLARVGRAA
jgi:hypothetical protein